MSDPTVTPTPTEAPDQPDGIQAEHLDDYRIPAPGAAAERVVEFVKWFGDGIVRQDEPDEPPLYARDLCALACAVLHGYRADQPSRCMHTPAPSPAVSAPDLDAIRARAVEIVREQAASYEAVTSPEHGEPESLSSPESDMPEWIVARLADAGLLADPAALAAAHAETRAALAALRESVGRVVCAIDADNEAHVIPTLTLGAIRRDLADILASEPARTGQTWADKARIAAEAREAGKALREGKPSSFGPLAAAPSETEEGR